MDDPNVILRLTALTQPAEYAFRLKQNQSRHVEPPPHSEDMRESFSRESTASEWQDDGNTDDYSSQLLWTFDQKLKNDQQRLTFGSEPHRCDVFLGRHKMIGGLHFYITLDREKGVVVYDVSKNGMSVTYDGKAGLPRHKFRWILFHGYKIVVAINENLRFRVEVPSYAICKPEYDANVGDFLQRSQSDDLLFGQLRITSQDNTANPTQSLSPRRRPIYLRKRQIGRGEHGTVHEVVNVSSGVTYAAKSFKPGFDFVKEVEILKSLSHERILQYVDFSDELPTPFLVTPFMPYGNLNENQGISSISVLLQVLEALEYLHANGVVHRDIKPANILVQSRTNLKLGDFGLAQNNSTFKTFCGTPKYCAPEITKEEMLYDPKVDIWSLGVVVFERSYDCPERPKDLPHRRWCRKIIKAVEDQEDDPVIVLLTRMLKIRPEDRLSASDCLTESDHLRLKQFESPAFDDGNITPTQSTMLGASWTPTEILASSVILRAVRASQDHERVPTDNEDAQPEIYNPRLDTTYSSHRGEVPESRMTKRPRLFHERPVGDTVYLNRSNWSLADIPEGWTPTSTGRDAYGSPKPSSHLSRTPEDSNVHPPWDRQAGRGEVNKPSLMLQKTVVE
ncbi:hypothetical protein MMC08_007239, partial [Hypocenomyce scalaris]|nr:hypothetical protein [Hypocenomyce scalaris]